MDDDRLRKLEERQERLEQAFPYFVIMGGAWALIWASVGAWCQRTFGG